MSRNKLLGGTCLILAGCGLANSLERPALGQTAAPKDKAAPALEQVTVTAQKRVSTAQKTPIAMSVYTGAVLQKLGVHDIGSLSTIAPDVGFSESAGESIVVVRGISSRDTTEIGDPAVAIDTDGVFLNRTYAINSTLYDLDRVEVLRGPQGTLNGRNAVGGAINIITAKPTDKLEGSAALTYGNYDTLIFDGMANVPISREVQVRAAFTSRSNNGYREIPPYGRADDEDAKSGRLEVAFEPFEHFKGLVTFQGTHLGGVGQAIYNAPYLYDPAGNLIHDKPYIPNYGLEFPTASQPSLDMLEKALRWQFSYEFPRVTLSYLGGYDVIDYHQISDSSSATQPESWNDNETPKTQNEEIRLSSNGHSRLTWQTGVYYFHEQNNLFNYDSIPTVYSERTRTLSFGYDVDAESVAGYAQAGYAILPNLKISGGIRYNYDDKRRTGNLYLADTASYPYSYTAIGEDGHKEWTKATYHAGLDWQITNRNLAYVKFDTGYKPGGFTDLNAYGPESVKAYEIGFKNRFFHDRMQFNIAGFYEDYTGQQVSQIISNQFGGGEVVVNAGSSTVYGVEPDLSLLVPGVGRFDVALQWLHARFDDFVTAVDGVNKQFSGNTLPQAPDISLGLGFSRSWDIPTGMLTADVRSKFQSAQHFSFLNYGDDRQGPYTDSSVTLEYVPNHGNWKLQGYLRNLENSKIFVDAQESGYSDSYRYSFAPPRTYGAQLSMRF